MEYNKVFKIAAFDLDGTLLDSADDLIYSLNLLLKEKNQSPMKKSNVSTLNTINNRNNYYTQINSTPIYNFRKMDL